MRNPAFFALLLLLSLSLLSCTTARPPQTYDLLLTHVNVVDVEQGKLLRNRTVWINAGLIQEIGDAGARNKYKAATTLDAKGQYLIPGLWDNHVHLRGGAQLEEANKDLLPLYIINGITTVRDAGGDLYPAVQAWREAIAANKLVGPRIISAGPKLDGPKPTWAGSIEVATVAQVPVALDSLQKLGVDFVKIYDSTISGDVFLAIVKEAQARGMLTAGHMPFSVKLGDAIDNGLDITEHLYYTFKAASTKEDSITNVIRAGEKTGKPVGFYTALHWLYDTYDPATAAQIYQKMAAHHTAVTPTLYIGRVLNNLSQADHSHDEYLHYIKDGIIKTYAGRENSAKRQTPEARAFIHDLEDKFTGMVPQMQAAGVTILAGSDAGAFNSYVYPGQSLHQELRTLQEAGLTPAQTLRTATLNGATVMGKADQYGTIATGKVADLVLLSKNPLEDIRNTEAIEAVIFGGKVYTAAELKQLLEWLKK
ncbi:amidohydrolase family protein [Pontibacter liquoris]|uniref:amidohydrolase family protein n=1 Tax=Pontibacter liquoris TaxID=2905677 RepID=UPI001FA771AE|nr:amidohydrolase family protein [Pontibacter liquoris]